MWSSCDGFIVVVMTTCLIAVGGWIDVLERSTHERYEFSTNTWSQIPPLSPSGGGLVVSHAGCEYGGRAYVSGGNRRGNVEEMSNELRSYDPDTSQNWTVKVFLKSGLAA